MAEKIFRKPKAVLIFNRRKTLALMAASIELSDIGSLKLEEYDKLCGIERQTYPTMAMNRKKWKYNKNNRTYESKSL